MCEQDPINFQYTCGGSTFKFNRMEMETTQMAELRIQEKPGPEINQSPMENDVNPELQTDEMPASEVNEEPVETCKDTVAEAGVNPEKQADLKAISMVDQKPIESCQETVLEGDVNQETQAEQKAISVVDQKPMEPCQETVVEGDVNPEKQAGNPGVIYRCKKCRRMVATQEYVVTHEVGRGEESFKTRKKYHVEENKPECMCIFVEPMKWMQAGRICFTEAFLHGMQSSAGAVQLGRHAVQLRNLGDSSLPADQKQDRRMLDVIMPSSEVLIP
ncbi:hypothetical protein ACP70R_029184 [Stipagrostis hirtigluma subsp. patula]